MTVEVPETLDPWVPTLQQIAAYVPAYTVAVGVGSDAYLGTFTDATSPTAAEVKSIRADAVSWLLSATGPLVGDSPAAGSSAVALRTAGMVALTTTPTQTGATELAGVLLAQADALLKALVPANIADGGGSVESSTGVPVWSIEPFRPDRFAYFNGRPFQ